MPRRKPVPAPALEEYNAKRDFTVTPEPPGEITRRKSGQPTFVVQKHQARRLHWDLRLEIDGVLKSWAVTKGPSLDPHVKRLAVRTEDHPLTYADFEGTIPAKEYGGGTMAIWDRGTWGPIPGKSVDTLESGHLHFILEGQRLKGEWILIRLPAKAGEKRENWLLKKVDDDYAAAGTEINGKEQPSITPVPVINRIVPDKKTKETFPLEPRKRIRLGRWATPSFRSPQLAMPSSKLPSSDGWLFEVKYDGYRAQIASGNEGIFGWTRSGLDWSDRFAPIVEAVAKLDVGSLLIDGEVVALDDTGRPSFSALQDALRKPDERLLFFAFDLLWLDDSDWSRKPLIERKKRLAKLLQDVKHPLYFAEHIEENGQALLDVMKNTGYEGVIAKSALSQYRSGRSGDWLKIKVDRREEFVIVGYIASPKKVRSFSSLLLAQYEDEALVYKGRVGTGFTDEVAAEIAARMERQSPPPVVNASLAAGRPLWVRPTMVVEVRFAEYTSDRLLRHASFIGLRDDKPAREVVPEARQKEADSEERKMSKWTAPEPSIPISNPDRKIFGDANITKRDLASWYEAIAPYALPWFTHRPLSLLRCPSGITGQCFFQKHLKEGWGDAVRSILLQEKNGDSEPVFVVHDTIGILQCVQMGTIEFHGWGSLERAVELPDRLIFDLDPDEGLDFNLVISAAIEIHDHLADIGLRTFPMVTGGKGIHVIAPLKPKANWEKVEAFANSFAAALEQANPRRYTQSMSKTRRKGKIFIDWMRNRRGSTAILPWSVRAREGAGVAVPVRWEQLQSIKSADMYTLSDPSTILEQARDMDADWGLADQILPGI